MDDLLADFLTEVSEGLSELDTALVTLERAPGDAATLGLIFRQVHTIKGTCGFLGLPRLERVAHAAEDVLGRVRDGELAASPAVIAPVLAAIDRIKDIVGAIAASGGTEPDGDDAALAATLAAIAAGTPAAPAPVARRAPVLPAVVIPPPAPLAEPAAPAAPSPAAGGGDAPLAQTIRVGVDTLESLMTLVGELVLTRNQLLQLSRSQTDQALAVPLQRLSRLTAELQDSVMKTRMQPIGHAWNKLPRLVRDLAVELGKEIDLDMVGADTELDRQVLEQIRDPLTHVVRNAADHGLEGPAERRAAGKHGTGRITLRAFHEGGVVVIEIADDGRGLNIERIRAKALQSGLATETELAAMSDAQIARFIFAAGFSTAAAVTAVSGRGVGMDVVRVNIERINGTIDLRSVPGAGTTLTIRIPLTLAIVPGLIVRVGGDRFVLPQGSVLELVRPGPEREGGVCVDRIGGTRVLRLRERLLPLVELAPALGLAAPADAAGVVAVVRAGGTAFGIAVDEVFDTEEIVVKPVAAPLRHLPVFSGVTILGDGAVIMILDPGGLARAAGLDADTRPADAATVVAATSRASDMLLFRADGGLRAVRLDAVARLELMSRAAIEHGVGGPVTQYRGQLMPLVGRPLADTSEQPVLVLGGDGRAVGLMVDAIVDIVAEDLRCELAGAADGILGTAVLAGRATDVIDVDWTLRQASPAWVGRAGALPLPAAANTAGEPGWGVVA